MENDISEDLVELAVSKMINSGIAKSGDIKGCDSDEIAKIESKFSVTLPSAYKNSLEKAGKSAGKFLTGSDFYYPIVLDLKVSADELLSSRHTDFHLEPTDFVFFNASRLSVSFL